MGRVAPYLKAVTASLVAGLSSLAAALANGSLSVQDYVYASIAFLVALGAVWAVPSKPASGP